MMSETVNMPAKHDFSLFHNGAETTPRGIEWDAVSRGKGTWDDGHTIEE